MSALLISMQGIANLAEVKRPAVTQWQTRFPSTSATPFPQPVETDPLLKFDAHEVARWLVATNHGNNAEAVEDAAFHSELFLDATKSPAVWAALAVHALTGEEVTPQLVYDRLFLEPLVPKSVLNSDLEPAVAIANELAEAGFSAVKVLQKIIEYRRNASAEGMITGAELCLDAVGSEIAQMLSIDEGSREIVALGAGGDTWAQRVSGAMPVPSRLALQYSRFSPEMCLSIGLGIPVEVDTDEWDPSAVVLMRWLAATADTSEEFFNQVDLAVTGIDQRGCVLVVGPADLLISSQSEYLNTERKNCLWPSRTSLQTSLRFAALLPKGWTRHLGQKQLALWALRNSVNAETANDVVVLADYAVMDLAPDSVRHLVRDVLAAVDNRVNPRSHTFHKAEVIPQRIARTRDSLMPTLERQVSISKAVSMTQLRESASSIGITPFNNAPFAQAGNPYAPRRKQLVNWAQATNGPEAVVKLLSGFKLADINVANPDGTVPVIGRSELLGLVQVGERKVDLLELEFKLRNAHLTEPDDVLFAFDGSPHVFVDSSGGVLVEAPVQVLRCRQTRGRTKELLKKVTSPHLLAQQLSKVKVKKKESWLVPVVDREDAVAFETALVEVNAKRQELQTQLDRLDSFQLELGEALVSGAIRAAPG